MLTQLGPVKTSIARSGSCVGLHVNLFNEPHQLWIGFNSSPRWKLIPQIRHCVHVNFMDTCYITTEKFIQDFLTTCHKVYDLILRPLKHEKNYTMCLYCMHYNIVDMEATGGVIYTMYFEVEAQINIMMEQFSANFKANHQLSYMVVHEQELQLKIYL